jgi:signal transduction histidine kinase
LERSSISNRLVGMLVLSVLVPAMILGWYALHSVLNEEALYRSELRDRAERLAEHFHQDLGARYHQLFEQVSNQTEDEGDAWVTEPDEAATRLRQTDSAVLGALVFDKEGALTSPGSLASWPQPDLSSLPVVNLRWQGSAGEAQIQVLLDPLALAPDFDELLDLAQRINPEFEFNSVAAVSEPGDPDDPGDIYFDRDMAPWLPGATLRVGQSQSFLAGERGRHRMLRVAMIVGLLIVVLTGIVVIARAVSREVEVARLKSNFLSSVSHELRTPLTTIRIMAEMLSMGAVASDEKRADYHRNIVSEADRLTRLINNVLDFARIEDGRKKFEFGFGDIADALYEVERITGDYARKEGFTLKTVVDEALPPICFDRDAMIQALINLVSNAVKYSRDEKYIELGAAAHEDNITIWVEDHGPGIEASEIPHLFERFYRGGDHMTREAGGTGLGLSIVQHIVSAHGGRVRVDSKVGRGSRFEIILPLDGPAEGTGAESRV